MVAEAVPIAYDDKHKDGHVLLLHGKQNEMSTNCQSY